MAVHTKYTFLMNDADSSGKYEKLVDIVTFPKLGGESDDIDITTLTNDKYVYMPGLQKLDTQTVDVNYTPTDYAKILELEGQELSLAIWFGGTDSGDGNVTPTGADGKFSFKGYLSPYVEGGGVNEKVTMKITITFSTEIAFGTN